MKKTFFRLPSKNAHPLKAAQQVSFQDTTASTLSSSFLKLSQDTELQKLQREKLQGPEGESDLVRVVQLWVVGGVKHGLLLLHSVAPTISSPKKKKNIGCVGSLFCKVKHWQKRGSWFFESVLEGYATQLHEEYSKQPWGGPQQPMSICDNKWQCPWVPRDDFLAH